MDLIKGLGIEPELLLAQVFNFLILLLVLYKFLYKPILDLLEKRRKTIEESLQTAEKIKQEDLALVVKKQEILTQAREETLKIIKEAKKEGEEIKKEILQKAEEEARRILEGARISIKEEKEILFEELKKEIADLAILISSRIITKRIDKKDEERLIEETIKETRHL